MLDCIFWAATWRNDGGDSRCQGLENREAKRVRLRREYKRIHVRKRARKILTREPADKIRVLHVFPQPLFLGPLANQDDTKVPMALRQQVPFELSKITDVFFGREPSNVTDTERAGAPVSKCRAERLGIHTMGHQKAGLSG